MLLTSRKSPWRALGFLAQDGLQGGGPTGPPLRYNRSSLRRLPQTGPTPPPGTEASTNGEHPGPDRRRQVLRDGPNDALARRGLLPPLLLGRGDQGRAGRHPAEPAALPMPLLSATLRRPHRHDLRRPSQAAEDLDHLPVPDGIEPLRLTDRQGARHQQGRRPGDDPATPPGDRRP